MSESAKLDEFYHLVVRRLVRRGVAGPKPFVWEIQHKDSAHVLRGGTETFATMEDAHQSGLSALASLRSASAREL